MTLIPFNRLVPPPKANDNLTNLVRSIKIDGLIEALIVTPAGASFFILEGKRRYRAISILCDTNEMVWDRLVEQERPARDLYGIVHCDVVD